MSSQANIDGGELFIRTLERAGVSDIFTLHGGHLDSIFQACLIHDIRLIDTPKQPRAMPPTPMDLDAVFEKLETR